ncbi:Ca-transporting ATPase, truncated [Laccaria bicolor S238N-H82]|uniref:Ca-transporting ATPase, truncated n=1 Tax=Laccaria bicolor (strain S238N-H82 / ATCC MYA-4686) TaxID=486041 RepID=B0D9J4_LACBS|nr:Ca-transporting ATPase, truncated [Laccaria bicolor S238N-H82]EDR08362.1 Ca-transporting ATPase, truncated [Laccaria bicolor S238N-H82]|eukprot:XP_001880587.1 Ca-transporting ATPase, truncated [Laccaria bicolor S238N-H82]
MGAGFFAISVVVGITPEMLPKVVVSSPHLVYAPYRVDIVGPNFAHSAVRVARKKVIVKVFEAIQSLGAVNILCSDKTGTLTIDLVRVSGLTPSSGEPSDLPLKLA